MKPLPICDAVIADAAISRSKTIILGMPQLCVNGLSENWLLKEAGSMHWSLICHALGQHASEIYDSFGNKLLATFVASDLKSNSLASFEEDERIALTTSLTRLSRQRFISTTQLVSIANPARCATLTLTSIFKRRRIANDNQAPARNSEARATPLPAHITGSFDAADAADVRSIDYEIFPLTDFNGAGLLYFANFQAIIDRCEWSLFPEWRGARMATQNRSITFLGNVNADDGLRLVFLPKMTDDMSRRLECLVFRRSDAKLLVASSVEKAVFAG
jgi:probable biosynthetic protein (TIGR04099 family)